jgi:hypothetical protein
MANIFTSMTASYKLNLTGIPLIAIAYDEKSHLSVSAMGIFLGLNIVYTYAASGEVTQLPIDIAWAATNVWSGMGILTGPLFSGKIHVPYPRTLTRTARENISVVRLLSPNTI